MKETIVLTRVHFDNGIVMWPFQVFTPDGSDPQVVARIHLHAAVKATNIRKGG